MENNFEKIGRSNGHRVEWLESAGSTNDVIAGGSYSHGDVVIADAQTAGRGQRGNAWNSERGLNLTFSMLLEPDFMMPDRQFLLSEAVALSLTDMLDSYGIEARIKWPNDIYVGDRKIAGILIENDIMGIKLRRSIVGVGLNVNQRLFDAGIPNPVSMSLVTGREYRLDDVFGRWYGNMLSRYGQLEDGHSAQVEQDYMFQLYRVNEVHDYRVEDEIVEGKIRHVKPSGELVLENMDGVRKKYLFKEIEYIINLPKPVNRR